jgi:hypothetical protein
VIGVCGAVLGVPVVLSLRQGFVIGLTWFQGRYLLPLIAVMLTVFLVRYRDGGVRSMGRATSVIAAILLSGAQCVALYTVIKRYVSGAGSGWANLNGGVQWWWPAGPSPTATWLLGSLGFITVALCLVWVTPVRAPRPVRGERPVASLALDTTVMAPAIADGPAAAIARSRDNDAAPDGVITVEPIAEHAARRAKD